MAGFLLSGRSGRAGGAAGKTGEEAFGQQRHGAVWEEQRGVLRVALRDLPGAGLAWAGASNWNCATIQGRQTARGAGGGRKEGEGRSGVRGKTPGPSSSGDDGDSRNNSASIWGWGRDILTCDPDLVRTFIASMQPVYVVKTEKKEKCLRCKAIRCLDLRFCCCP